MPRKKQPPLPLGLPDQVDGLSTAPTDRGDETQERFRYQWAIGVCLLAQGLTGKRHMHALWCEHHEDFLIELGAGQYVAVQVKTRATESAGWRWSDKALVDAVGRFCSHEQKHGKAIQNYEFQSNAAPYVPAATANKDKTVSESPERLIQCCREASKPSKLAQPYLDAFKKLLKTLGCEEAVLFKVLRKLRFCQGPPLRGYDDTLCASVIPAMPGCESMPLVACCHLRDELVGLVEGACRLSLSGIDGAVAYIASNGRPDPVLRGKCITPESVREVIAHVGQSRFRFICSGMGLQLGDVPGRTNVLQRKMRNAYIGGQFESLRVRMDSADQHLLERALLEPEGFDAVAAQLLGAVLVECKDIEALSYDHVDDKTRGPAIYKQLLQRMEDLAMNEPERVCREPKDILMGVAGMLSGECRFAWGVPLEEPANGA